MKIDNQLLTKLETLSALQIAEDKREGVINQLSEIVEFVENLNELNLDNEEATFTTVAGGTPMRDDVPNVDPEIKKIILENAPLSEGDFFVVPKIIE